LRLTAALQRNRQADDAGYTNVEVDASWWPVGRVFAWLGLSMLLFLPEGIHRGDEPFISVISGKGQGHGVRLRLWRQEQASKRCQDVDETTK